MDNTNIKEGHPNLLIEFTDTEGSYGCVSFGEFKQWFIHPDGTGRLVTHNGHYHFVKNVAEVEFRLRELARLEREYVDATRALLRKVSGLEVRVSELSERVEATEPKPEFPCPHCPSSHALGLPCPTASDRCEQVGASRG